MINFNGIDLGTYGKVNQIKRNILPPNQLTTEDIPGRPGLLLLAKKHGARRIEVTMTLKAAGTPELAALAEDFAFAIDSDDIVEITIQDEPGRSYFGIVIDEIDKEDITHRMGVVTFTIICPDPYKYGPPITTLLTDGSEKKTVTNPGTVETYPTFKLTVKEPITFASIIQQDAYVLLGSPDTVEDTPKAFKTKILSDSCATVVGWTSGSTVQDGGANVGTMVSDGNNFVASSFGTGTNWHGPSLKKSLSEQLTDFRAEFWIDFQTNNAQVGRAEMYLLGPSNEVIGKVSIKDAGAKSENVQIEVRVGPAGGPGHFIWQGSYPGDVKKYNKFYGMIAIERRYNQWKAELVGNRATSTKPYLTRKTYWYDTNDIMRGPISQVCVNISAYGSNPTPGNAIKIRAVNVIKFLTLGELYEVPYIADTGDVIIIDNASGEIYVNDLPAQDLYNPSTRWFALAPGDTEVTFLPQGKVDVEIIHRGRWK